MAAVKKHAANIRRVSPLKPSLRGAQMRNWTSAQMRAARNSPRALWFFTLKIFALLSVLVFLALWLGGFLPEIRYKMHAAKVDRLMSMGFVVEQVDVLGDGRLNPNDVRQAVGIYPGSYFFGVDLNEAKLRAESLPWVDRAVVRRLWPNRITVQIVETTPYAVWQNNGTLTLLSDEGDAIIPVLQATSVPAGLKTYVGPHAPEHAKNIEADIRAFPHIWSRTESLVRHPQGRWDLHMTNGTRVQLPEKGVAAALVILNTLDHRTQLLSREVGTVDLRLADRVSIRAKAETTT